MGKIKEKALSILKKSDAKHIAMLSAGVLSGQAISMIAQLITTRLYSPEAFGNLSLIVSLASMYTPIATLQYHISIVNAQDDDEYPLCKLNVFTILLTSVIFLIGLIINQSISPGKYKDVGNWVFVSVLLFLMTGITSLVESYNNRHSEYKLMSKVTLQRSIVSNVVRIILGFFKTNFIGLVISQCLGTIAGIKKQSQSMIKHMKEILAAKNNDVIRVAKKYIHQPLYALPGLFILQFSYSNLAVIINTIYSSREGGFFSLSVTVLGLPLSLVSNNVARVFFKKASEEKEKTGCFYNTFKNTSILLITVSFIGFFILWLIAEPLFGLFYGQAWIRGGTLVKFLVPMYAMRFILTGMLHGFVICNKQRLKTILQSLFIIAMGIGYYLAKYCAYTIEEFLTFINWSYFLLYILLFIVLWRQSRIKSQTS